MIWRLRKWIGLTPRRESRFVMQLTDDERQIIGRAQPFTMTGQDRLLSLIDAVNYVVQRGVPGDFVECGVWRGGSVMAMLLRMQQLGANDRDIYLYDTFEGMTAPTDLDVSHFDGSARSIFERSQAEGTKPWSHLFNEKVLNEDLVRQNVESTGYPSERIHLVKGRVEDTIPQTIPEQIAILRLDTDWYESTRHELQHMWHRLAPGGVLIIDDYGHWDGCRKAVDEFFGEGGEPPVLLNRIDYSGRIAVKA